MKIDDMTNLKNCIECLEQPLTKQVLQGYVEEFKKEVGISNARISFTTHSYGLKVLIVAHGHQAYDWLMNSKHTSISNDILAIWSKKVVFPRFNADFTIDFMAYCDLPKEDFKTLDSLGKVHREWVGGHNEQSIYCEI